MLQSRNLPTEIPVERVKKIAEMLGVEEKDFGYLTHIEIKPTEVFLYWEDLHEVGHIHKMRIQR